MDLDNQPFVAHFRSGCTYVCDNLMFYSSYQRQIFENGDFGQVLILFELTVFTV